MKRDLAALNRTIKEFLHHDGYDNIRAMDPWIGLKHLEPDQIWGSDPVHVKLEHLGNLVRGIQISLEKLSPKKGVIVMRRQDKPRGRGLRGAVMAMPAAAAPTAGNHSLEEALGVTTAPAGSSLEAAVEAALEVKAEAAREAMGPHSTWMKGEEDRSMGDSTEPEGDGKGE
jgi:hypothetical protein